jgi:hypothetical protein
MKDESFFRIVPADNLTKPKVIEYKGIAPIFHGVKPLGKSDEIFDVLVMAYAVEQ